MEALPPEMVEKVCRYLSPQDLARSCAVSHKWRQIFNQDWLWEPHCDPALVQPLRITPSIVEPTFMIPEVEDSTMLPISQWRLAYMRENHLWGNWNRKIFKKEGCKRLGKESKRSFLTDTLLVNWCPNSIEIWDVSVIPAILILKSDSSIQIWGWFDCNVFESNMLLVVSMDSVQVFLVDVINRSIKLEHKILFDESRNWPFEDFVTKQQDSVNGSRFIGVYSTGSKLSIFDLRKGKKIREEGCPVMENKNMKSIFFGINTSKTSDDLLVGIWDWSGDIIYFIYSLKQQLYLPGPIAKVTGYHNHGVTAINKHCVAIGALPSLLILDYHSSEVLFKNEGQQHNIYPQCYNDTFIFEDRRDGRFWLKMFSLTSKTITTFFEHEPIDLDQAFGLDVCELKIVNNKFVVVFDKLEHSLPVLAAFEPKGQTLTQVDILSLEYDGIVNKTFTRGVWNNPYGESFIFHYW